MRPGNSGESQSRDLHFWPRAGTGGEAVHGTSRGVNGGMQRVGAIGGSRRNQDRPIFQRKARRQKSTAAHCAHTRTVLVGKRPRERLRRREAQEVKSYCKPFTEKGTQRLLVFHFPLSPGAKCGQHLEGRTPPLHPKVTLRTRRQSSLP